MKNENKHKWKVAYYKNDRKAGVIRYALENESAMESRVVCESTKSPEEVQKDIDNALSRLNRKYKLKGL